MASIGTISFKGISGENYEFKIYDINSSWNEVAAVYVVTRRCENSDGKFTHSRIYIGQTDNLESRFSDHHKQSCFDSNNANCLCILQKKNENERLEIETDLINGNTTKCNKQ